MSNNNTSISTVSAVTTAKTFIATANKWRRGIIQALFNSAIVRNISGTTVAPSAEIPNLDTLSADFLTVGTNPAEKSFSSRDIVHFGNELADERDVTKAKLAEVVNVITVAHGRINPLFLKDRTHFTCVVAKCNAVLSFLREELDRREVDEKNRLAAIAEAKRQQAELDRAEHAAFLATMREKYALKPKVAKVPNHAPHADKLIGKGLESLAILKEDMIITARKSGKFTSERVMTKSEALTVAQDLSNLPLVFPDGRVLDVVLNKAGKVYRYLLKE